MISTLSFKEFAGVPYLETSSLAQTHGGQVAFACDRPTVLVGPNGSGKSALLTALALRLLAYFTGESTFDDKFVRSTESKAWWTKSHEWRNDFTYLQGFSMTGDNAPALYYRPSHIPGNEQSVAAAMMCGYFEEARGYDRAVSAKSSGQASQALLGKALAALAGSALPHEYLYRDWRAGKTPHNLRNVDRWLGDYDYKAEVLKAQFASTEGVPVILLDEPEQSLDALAEVRLWKLIEAADCRRMQVIVASHSLYPLLNPNAFHLIETEPGYCERVTGLL
jgi:ABC-type cobalamin/Fe3+-siderophores transport system ATPase subunit